MILQNISVKHNGILIPGTFCIWFHEQSNNPQVSIPVPLLLIIQYNVIKVLEAEQHHLCIPILSMVFHRIMHTPSLVVWQHDLSIWPLWKTILFDYLCSLGWLWDIWQYLVHAPFHKIRVARLCWICNRVTNFVTSIPRYIWTYRIHGGHTLIYEDWDQIIGSCHLQPGWDGDLLTIT